MLTIKKEDLLRFQRRKDYHKSHLLYFKLTFASPVESDITIPRDNNDEYFVDFDGVDKERMERALRIAIINQLQT